ncbi:uncharacterized protein [Solanum tuberosum]|nr:PREDICTED: uncharacterized protein LOC107057683 [Solanum tuberosum]
MNWGFEMGMNPFEEMGKRVPKRVWLRSQMTMVLMVGGNHTSSRFCTR